MKNNLFVFAFVMMAFACQSPKEKSLQAIQELESQDSIFSPEHIEKMKKSYLDFADKYPDDDLAPEYIFKAGQRCNVVAQHEEAIGLFQRIIDKYPKNKMSEEALFLQGYIYENSLHDQANAQRVYKLFIQKYPNSELTEDAELAIKNLGKTPEEIYESFGK